MVIQKEVVVASVHPHDHSYSYVVGVFDSEAAARFCFEQSGGKSMGTLQLDFVAHNPGTPEELTNFYRACRWQVFSEDSDKFPAAEPVKPPTE